jgi:endonuclease/exonuclease/phosphatase family metal-dependent hydrolase
MTFNVGAGKEESRCDTAKVSALIEKLAPDVVAVQEAVEWEDEDGRRWSLLDEIRGSEFCSAFGPTLALREHMHVRKKVFVDALFTDRRDWCQGNGLLSRFGFVGLGDPSLPGTPRNIPLRRPPAYLGDRDTDPRWALLARIDKPPLFPYILGTHLSTFISERERLGSYRPRADRREEAEIARYRETKRILDLLSKHVLDRELPILLLGDINAVPWEACIQSILIHEGGFVRLEPREEIATHPKLASPVDHILVAPARRLREYDCWVVDTPEAREASDHLPVVADVVLE